jgi:hypothetical protein
MERPVITQRPVFQLARHEEAWQMVLGQLRDEMTRGNFEQWVLPLRPLSYNDGTYIIGAYNPYARDWVESRLKSRITQILSGLYAGDIELRVVVANEFFPSADGVSLPERTEPEKPDELETLVDTPDLPIPQSSRKALLQRAYGSQRARLIQPERGMFITLYFLFEWLPLIGHSAMTIILAARSLCYWNPKTGELRNKVETDMSELAARASVSVRTVKQVLNLELVQQYFLRYKVRRVMTSNGVRTAGILLQVRMDDPLTPADQEKNQLPEEETWYSPEFDDEID